MFFLSFFKVFFLDFLIFFENLVRFCVENEKKMLKNIQKKCVLDEIFLVFLWNEFVFLFVFFVCLCKIKI